MNRLSSHTRLPFSSAALVALALSLGLPAAAATYDLDPAHAAAHFEVSHFGVSNTWGRFNNVGGQIVIDEKAPTKSTMNVTIDTASVDSNSKKRDDHLRGPDFFNAKQFPKMTFKSKKIVPAKGNVWNVTGDLTLHGVTKEVTVPVKKIGEGKDPWGGYRIGYDATFKLNRNDYGITFMPGGVGDNVTIHLALEGVKKK